MIFLICVLNPKSDEFGPVGRGDAARRVLVPELRPLLGRHGALGPRLPLAPPTGPSYRPRVSTVHVLLHHLDCV